MTANRSRVSRNSTLRALLTAGLLLGTAAALSVLSPDHVSPELAQRLLGCMIGAFVVAYANVAPKTLAPLAQTRRDPAADQAMRRFTGWTIVLGGVAYILAWLIAPIQYANAVSAACLAIGLVLVIGRYTLGNAGGTAE